VLAGIIASLLAQGLPPLEAAKAGVYFHGLAGDIAAENLGQISMISSDIINYLPEAFLKEN
jgi:NAD(P)H-hydrate epimerase